MSRLDSRPESISARSAGKKCRCGKSDDLNLEFHKTIKQRRFPVQTAFAEAQ
jgi:hypothetical protein